MQQVWQLCPCQEKKRENSFPHKQSRAGFSVSNKSSSHQKNLRTLLYSCFRRSLVLQVQHKPEGKCSSLQKVLQNSSCTLGKGDEKLWPQHQRQGRWRPSNCFLDCFSSSCSNLSASHGPGVDGSVFSTSDLDMGKSRLWVEKVEVIHAYPVPT